MTTSDFTKIFVISENSVLVANNRHMCEMSANPSFIFILLSLSIYLLGKDIPLDVTSSSSMITLCTLLNHCSMSELQKTET